MNTYYLKKFRKRFTIISSTAGRFMLFDKMEDRVHRSRDEHHICVVEGLVKLIGIMTLTNRIRVIRKRNAKKEGFTLPA